MKHFVKNVIDEIFSQNKEKLEAAGVKLMFADETEECIVIRIYDAKKDVFCRFDSMEILKREIPMIRKIVQDECWYLGEKMNRPVSPREVEQIVAKIVLKIGEQLRIEAITQLKSEKCIHDCQKCKWNPTKTGTTT